MVKQLLLENIFYDSVGRSQTQRSKPITLVKRLGEKGKQTNKKIKGQLKQLSETSK